MTEDELEHKINEYGEAYYHGEGGGEEEIKAAILAAFAELRAERDAALERERVLREAVEKVEFVYTSDGEYGCPWCGEFSPPWDTDNPEHAPDCLRQRAQGVKP